MATRDFHWADYLVFALSLVLTAALGLFMSLWKRKNTSPEELLLASRSMHFLPLSLSGVASMVNAAAILGLPADIHFFGFTGMPMVIAYFLAGPVTGFVIAPTFYKMKLTSAYEYLENRYNRTVRIAGSLLFTISLIFFLAVVLYAPSLAFSQVTSLSLTLCIVLTGAVCTLYTMLGGIKAVIWTDTIQMVILFIGIVVLIGVGADEVGGMSKAVEIAQEGGRLKFAEWSWDPLIRYTFWGQTIGQWVIFVAIAWSNQMLIQRYLAAVNLVHVKISSCLSFMIIPFILILLSLLGIVIYAKYAECDPLVAQQIAKGDQIVPFYLMDILGDRPGLPGLFSASVFAAALSSVSSAVNSLAAVTLEDFIKPAYKSYKGKDLKNRPGTILATVLALIFGVATIALSFIAEFMAEKLVEATGIIWSIIGGPLAAIFIMGFFFPWINSAGALSGMLVSLALSLWLGIGGILYKEPTPPLPLGLQCIPPELLPKPSNHTSPVTPPPPPGGDYQDFYNISFAWYAVFSVGLCMVVAHIVSFISYAVQNCIPCKMNCKAKKDNLLYYNCVDKCYCYCPSSVKEACRCGVQHDKEKDVPVLVTKIAFLENKIGVENTAFDEKESNGA